EELGRPIADMLAITHCVGSRMEIVDGRYTGTVEYYCYGEYKAIAARRLAAEHGYDLAASHAYTDSSTDLPLLETVGHPHAVNPDKAVRRIAVERGWPVQTFTKPVAPRDLTPTSATAAAAGSGVSAVAAGAAL